MRKQTVTFLLIALGLAFCQQLTPLKVEELQKEGIDIKRDFIEAEDAELVKRSCPGNCNGNGYCVSSSCQCYQGYSGVDCSIYSYQLVSGQAARGNAATFEFKYYYLTTQYAANILVQLNQTDSTGDIDLYVQLGSLPTRSDYLIRDVSTRSSVSFVMTDAAPGTYYFGAYGFIGGSYMITVTNQGECPNACSGHGSCLGGNCVCYGGWSGPACDQQVTQLTPGVDVPGSGQRGIFNYYTYRHGSSSTSFTVTLTETSTSGDCDLYIQYESVPTLFSYADANVTTRDISTLSVLNPQVGLWYIGVYPFSTCTYNIGVSSADACPNECSRRGTCNGGDTCQCQPGYTGSYCETSTSPLRNGVAAQGFVDRNAWNYWTYNSGTVDNMVVALTQASTNADCDLYIKAGTKPTRTSYDFHDGGVMQNFTVTVPNAGRQTWYFGVYGWSQCAYNIMASETSQCPNGCSGHGQCLTNGACLCDHGFSGIDCSMGSGMINSDQVYPGSVQQGNWTYYTIRSQGASTLYVTVKETSTSGFLWVYMGAETPTLRSYSQASTGTNTNTHRLVVTSDEDVIPDMYQIGVYGNPFAPSNFNVNYVIEVFVVTFAQ